MDVQTFQDLIVWQKSHRLILLLYKLTEKYPRHELFGLISQTRRCGVSIPSNIAEGFKRKTITDSIHFCNMADTSLEELKYDLILARDLKYINESEYNQAMGSAEEVGRLLNGWKKSKIRGKQVSG